MHIMEGFLPPEHCIGWGLAAAPFVVTGVVKLKKIIATRPEARLTLAAAGAFSFVLSALKLPSVTGSSSHPTGVGLGAITFGPMIMAALGPIVLLFQALLLAHGGLTTLGANIFSMAVVGPWVSWALWRGLQRCRVPFSVATFLAVAVGSLATYGTTAIQLALAYSDPVSGFSGAFIKFFGIFAVTQIPLAIIEGLVTVVAIIALTEPKGAEPKGTGPKEAGSQEIVGDHILLPEGDKG